jgi:hypothetical protein
VAFHAFNPRHFGGAFGPAGVNEGRWRRDGGDIVVSLAGSNGYSHPDITRVMKSTPLIAHSGIRWWINRYPGFARGRVYATVLQFIWFAQMIVELFHLEWSPLSLVEYGTSSPILENGTYRLVRCAISRHAPVIIPPFVPEEHALNQRYINILAAGNYATNKEKCGRAIREMVSTNDLREYECVLSEIGVSSSPDLYSFLGLDAEWTCPRLLSLLAGMTSILWMSAVFMVSIYLITLVFLWSMSSFLPWTRPICSALFFAVWDRVWNPAQVWQEFALAF